ETCRGYPFETERADTGCALLSLVSDVSSGRPPDDENTARSSCTCGLRMLADIPCLTLEGEPTQRLAFRVNDLIFWPLPTHNCSFRVIGALFRGLRQYTLEVPCNCIKKTQRTSGFSPSSGSYREKPTARLHVLHWHSVHVQL